MKEGNIKSEKKSKSIENNNYSKLVKTKEILNIFSFQE